MNDPQEFQYAVVGNPIAHSKSPTIHRVFAEQTEQRLAYGRILAPIEADGVGFRQTVHQFFNQGGLGLNVTAPFKQQALLLADSASAVAKQAGAANALRYRAGRIEAENFDGIGLIKDIQSNRGVSLKGKRVLILGAGGATRGVLGPILACEPKLIVVANRTEATAHQLIASWPGQLPIAACGFATITSQSDRFDIIVHATSSGWNEVSLPISPALFIETELAYDMTYGRGLTPFLNQAQSSGAQTLADGIGMLVEQAAEAFEWWRGIRPSTQAIIEQLEASL